MTTPQLTAKTKAMLVVMFFAAGCLFLAFTFWEPRDLAKECYEQCSKTKQFSRLVPTRPPQMVAQGKQYLMKCECY